MILKKSNALFVSVSYLNSSTHSTLFNLATRSDDVVLPGFINRMSLIYQKYVDCFGKNTLERIRFTNLLEQTL